MRNFDTTGIQRNDSFAREFDNSVPQSHHSIDGCFDNPNISKPNYCCCHCCCCRCWTTDDENDVDPRGAWEDFLPPPAWPCAEGVESIRPDSNRHPLSPRRVRTEEEGPSQNPTPSLEWRLASLHPPTETTGQSDHCTAGHPTGAAVGVTLEGGTCFFFFVGRLKALTVKKD